MANRHALTALPHRRSGYERVVSAVKHALAEGRYAGSMLPSYRKLTRELNVTMSSVQRAMAELEREGLIRRENGRGAFPCARRRPSSCETPPSLQCINAAIPPSPASGSLPSFVEADYLTGYTQALENYAIRMRFIAGDDLESTYDRLLSPVLPVNAQGVILINSCPPQLAEWLRHNGMPFVLQSYARCGTQCLPPHFGVYVNKAGGASQAVNHLLEIGHRSIGFMGMTDSSIPMAAEVFQGYRAALNCVGLDCAEDNLAHCEALDSSAIFAIAKAFLDRPRRPTAVLAGCDEFARSLLDAARALDLRVPEELSIVGFDNQPGAAKTDPPLTTVSVPRRELAQAAINLLLEAAEGPHVLPRTRILETHLIIRKTTAPLRGQRN